MSASAETGFGKTPLLFEINKGQTDQEAKFISRGKDYTLYLAGNEAVFSLKVPSTRMSDVLRMRFMGANAAPKIEGRDEAVTKTNYYSGKTRVENVSNYGRVAYKELYAGVDVIFYGNANNHLEYDFVVAPNGSADQIQLNFEGAEKVSVNEQGDLVMKTANTRLVQPKPFSYQEIEGAKLEITSRYIVSGEDTVRFETGEYDHSKPLIIDPALQYLTYLGGSLQDTISDVDADAQGNAYITGEVNSLDFPVPNSRQASDEAGIYVSKIDPDGQTILFNTFLDGSRSDGDFSTSLAVSAAG
ncbi:MAG TPA: SBBP repeat-containing protein, partial [Pyrinomonadaceae bacterium]|nr:SBBP repeat-containing protein [Pyrinomonadaceae bacterium]